MIGNCDSMLYLGGNDQTTLDYISKRLGKETIRSINNSRSYGKQGSHSMSYNKTGRELMTADELAVMDNKNCILFIRGEYPFFSEKYPYTKHPNYKYTGDASEKYFFDVKKMIQTGHNMVELKIEENMPLKVFTEAQRGDTRESDRIHRYHSRPVEEHSARGEKMLVVRPLSKVMPGVEIPPDQRTPEQAAALAEKEDAYAFEHTNFSSLKGADQEEYVDHLRSFYGGPDSEMDDIPQQS